MFVIGLVLIGLLVATAVLLVAARRVEREESA